MKNPNYSLNHSLRNGYSLGLSLISLIILPFTALGQVTGSVSGVVADAGTGAFLIGASVQLEGTSIIGYTDRGGRYRLHQVPAGEYNLNVSYLGLNDASVPVSVSAGQSVRQNVGMESDIVTLEDFVIKSIAQGQAAAYNQQRMSDTITNILSSDAFGNLPDASVGEAVMRMPGVGVRMDRGEAQFITVRGSAAGWNSISLNGDRIPSIVESTESITDRAVQLSSVPTGLIQSIEVIKAISANMDADSVGAAINLVTKSPLDIEKRIINGRIGYGYSDIQNGDKYSFDINYGDRFGERGNVGLILGLTYQYNNRGVQSFEPNYKFGRDELYDPVADDDVDVSSLANFGGAAEFDHQDEWEFIDRHIDRERFGMNGQLDFKVGEESRFYIKAYFNQFTSEDVRRRYLFDLDSNSDFLVGDTAPGGTGELATPNVLFVDGGRVRWRHRGGYKETTLNSFGIGGEHKFDNFDLDYSLSYSKSQFQVIRSRLRWQFRLSDFGFRDGVADWRIDWTDSNFPIIEDLGDPVPYHLNYQFHEIGRRGDYRRRNDINSEDDFTAQINFKKTMQFGDNPGSLKLGLKYRTKDKAVRQNIRNFRTNTGPDADSRGRIFLSDFISTDVSPTHIGGDNWGPMSRKNFFDETFWPQNKQHYPRRGTDESTNLGSSFAGNEDVFAAYVMATVDIKKLRVVAGLRYERTENTFNAFVAVDDVPDSVQDLIEFTPVSGSGSYSNLFPSILLTYRFNENLVARATVTTTLNRPDYGFLSPRVSIDTLEFDIDPEEGDPTEVEIEATIGNPNLKPMESTNFDLSIEWYFKNSGILSASFFYKDLTDFQFERTFEGSSTVPAGFPAIIPASVTSIDAEITQPQNAAAAEMIGVEFAWAQKFTFLPSPFDGFGIVANAAFVSGELTLPDRVLDVLPEQTDQLYNVQIYYEKYRFSARLAWNFNDDYLEQLEQSSDLDLWIGKATGLDFSFEYQFSDRFKFYFNASNVLDNERERKYRGTQRFVTQHTKSGRSYIAGIKFDL